MDFVEKDFFDSGKLLDTYLEDMMMIKLTKGIKGVMRHSVNENEAEPEMTKIRITRSGTDAWNGAQVMKTAWNEKQAERSNKGDYTRNKKITMREV